MFIFICRFAKRSKLQESYFDLFYLFRLGRKMQVMPSLQQELGLAISLDSRLLHESVASGEEIPLDEILSLASGMQALYLTTVLASRELAHVKDRRHMWDKTSAVFNELCACWADAGSDDPRIQWLVQRLGQCQELALEEAQIYGVRPSERRKHAMCREATPRTYGVHGVHDDRNELTPDGYRDQSTPQHVYSVGHF